MLRTAHPQIPDTLWASACASARARSRHYRLTTIVCALITVAASTFIVVESRIDKTAPYVVIVDKLNNTFHIGYPGTSSDASVPAVAVEHALRDWLSNFRTVYQDAAAQKAAVMQVPALLSAEAYNAIDAYWRLEVGAKKDTPNDPFVMRKKFSVSIAIDTYRISAPGTAQIVWTETTRRLNGEVLSTKKWQANLAYTATAPRTQKDAKLNPIGLEIQSVTWAELT